MTKVFVFGTLKSGFPNFHTNRGVRVGETFVTKQPFPLYLVGERCSPWLVLTPGAGHPVRGEVYEVSAEALANMDALERISEPDGYRKVEIDVLCMDSGKTLQVYVYGKPPEQLACADIRHTLAGEYLIEHAKLYRARS